MILADTSVWIDHFRRGDGGLTRLLEDAEVMTHPFVIGEIALGSLKRRRSVLSELADLPAVNAADDSEVLAFIEAAALSGTGVGYIDAHLMASVCLTPGARLWSRDRKLAAVARSLSIAFDPAD